MALLEYFPNYVWNLSLAIALESGGKIGEIVDMCAPLRTAAARGEDVGTGAFLAEWVKMADKLAALAAEDEARGRLLSAGTKLKRAALYYQTAERMQGHGHPGRVEIYARARDAFTRGTTMAGDAVRRVEFPCGDHTLTGLWSVADGEGPRPAVLYCNGLDSTKELLWFSWLPKALAKRGISCLCIDQPGTGEALRLHNLHATAQSEIWAAAAVDWMQTLPEVDQQAIGMTGISLGGYFVPRAVAFDLRFAAGAVWGANHDWADVQQQRMRREGENPVPHYWSHVWWVFGATDQQDFLAKSQAMTLEGVLDRITVPFLVTHGEQDRQIALDYARRTHAQLVASPRTELKIFTSREGGVEHVGADNMSFGRDYIADWFAETLGGT